MNKPKTYILKRGDLFFVAFGKPEHAGFWDRFQVSYADKNTLWTENKAGAATYTTAESLRTKRDLRERGFEVRRIATESETK